MRATIMYDAGDSRIENVHDARIVEPADAVIRITYAAICGSDLSMNTALNIARPGGAIGRVGIPHDVNIPVTAPTFFGNLTASDGPAPVRAYIEELIPDVLEGKIQRRCAIDQVVSLDEVPAGYKAMDERECIKVMIRL